MDFKILQTSYDLPDVLLHRDRNENGEEIVEIKAIGFLEDSDDQFCTESIVFDSHLSAKRFIKDFTIASAQSWCIDNDIKYSENHK